MTAGFDWRNVVQDGGFIMYPLIACSFVAIVVMVERGLALAGARRRGRKRARDVVQRAREAGWPSERAGAALERAKTEWSQDLRAGLCVLGTIGAAAPFVGLFGTVVGIIRSFHDIARTGQGGFAIVAAGISEALIATGAGIAVAVIAFAAHNFLQVRVSSLVTDFRLRGEELIEEARPS